MTSVLLLAPGGHMEGLPAVHTQGHITDPSRWSISRCHITNTSWWSISRFNAISIADCGQEIPQLRFPGWDDGSVAVPQERLRPGRVHQHLRGRQRDRAGLCGRGQAPQPILNLAVSPHRCCRRTPPSPQGLWLHTLLFHATSGNFCLYQATSLWHPWNPPACWLWPKSAPSPSGQAGIPQAEKRETVKLSAFRTWTGFRVFGGRCRGEPCLWDCHWPLLPILKYLLRCIRNLQHAVLIHPSSLSVTPRPNALFVLVRKRCMAVLVETESGWGRRGSGHVADTPLVTQHFLALSLRALKARLENNFRQSQFSAVLGTVWCDHIPGLMLISIICLGLARKGNWHAIPNWGTWGGEGRGGVLMPKGPWGLPAMGFACLWEWFHWGLHAWVWLCLSTVEFWSLRKQRGGGGVGGWMQEAKKTFVWGSVFPGNLLDRSFLLWSKSRTSDVM